MQKNLKKHLKESLDVGGTLERISQVFQLKKLRLLEINGLPKSWATLWLSRNFIRDMCLNRLCYTYQLKVITPLSKLQNLINCSVWFSRTSVWPVRLSWVSPCHTSCITISPMLSPFIYPYLAWILITVRLKTLFSCLTIQGSGLPRWLRGKESACQYRRSELDPWVRKILWIRKWQPIPVFLPWNSYGQRTLAGYRPRVTESDTTE